MNQPPKKSNALWWILGIIGVLTVGGALVCCGGMYFMIRFGTQVIGDQVKLAVSSDPVIQEHVGSVSSVSMNLTATSAAGGGNKIVFDVVGDKGTGQLEVVMDQTQGQEGIQSCVLVLPNGDRHDVAISPPADTSLPDVSEGDAETGVEAETNGTDEVVPPAETTPAETTPAETTPAETTPAETTPAETTPAESTPAVAEPAAQ